MKKTPKASRASRVERDLHGAINGLTETVTALTTSHNTLVEIVLGDPKKPFSFGVVRLVKSGVALLVAVVSIGLSSLWMQWIAIQRATFNGQAALVGQEIGRRAVEAAGDAREAAEIAARSAERTQRTLKKQVLPVVKRAAPIVQKLAPAPEPEPKRWWPGS